MKKNKIKFYFHQHYFHELDFPKNRLGFLKKLSMFFLRGIKNFILGLYGLCFMVGEWLVNFVVKTVKVFFLDFIKTKQVLKERFLRATSREFLASHAAMGVMVFCIVILFTGIGLFAKGLELKENVLSVFGKGRSDLETAGALLKEQKTDAAKQTLNIAIKNFKAAQAQIQETDAELKVVLKLLPQGADAQKILKASEVVSEGGSHMLAFYENLRLLKLTSEGISSAEENQKVLENSSFEIEQAARKLQQARELLGQVSLKSVPENFRADFLQVKKLAEKVSETSQTFLEIFGLLKNITAKSSNILLVLQNNNELRAAGGFIGSYATIKQNYGKMSSMKLGSIYDLDGQLKDRILPPMPIFAVNDRWYLRDSNWFLDFSKSAKKITEFYEKEGGETPDLVVALTPNLIVDLLKITGPVELPKYNVTLDSENFVERTQVLTEMDMTTPENTPKQFLADLMPVLLERLGRIKFDQLDLLTESFFKNLSEKHIQVYSRFDDIQDNLNAFNWGGRVHEADKDYLAVVSSNLGGTKSDLYIEQNLSLNTKIEKQKITNELVITFKNTLPDLENTFNKRFIRILVPKNSKLKSVSGFDYVNFERPELKNYKLDPDAKEWDENTSRNIVTGTLIGEESDKTFFGNWVTLKGGQERTVKVVYELPFRLDALDSYSLVLQKQAGALNFPYQITWNFAGRKLVWSSEGVVDNSSLNISGLLDQDKLFGAVLQSN